MEMYNKKNFIKYIREHVDFIDVLQTVDGTQFLSICGYDGGDLQATKIEEGPKYSDTQEVDTWINLVAGEFNVPKPTMTFTEFCSQKS